MSHSEHNDQPKIAVPYIPPPPPEDNSQRRFRSPFVNAMLIAGVILLGGFMLYNFIGHSLTQTAGLTSSQTSVAPSISPTVTPTPTPHY